MKKNIFKQTWAILLTLFVGTISGLIANSYTHRLGTLANLTNAVWEAVSQATVSAITYRIPIWTVVIAVALISLTWYAKTRYAKGKNSGAPKVSTPNFLTYRQDYFDGVLCRWDYSKQYIGTQYEIRDITCFCQHCDFDIGRPNYHLQQCPSCSKRAVRSEKRPYQSDLSGQITGYQQRDSSMPFEEFIRREIVRRLRTGAWQTSSNA